MSSQGRSHSYCMQYMIAPMDCRLGVFEPARVYDLLGERLAALNIFSLLWCLGLYIKACSLRPPAHQTCEVQSFLLHMCVLSIQYIDS